MSPYRHVATGIVETLEDIERDTERDRFMNAHQSKEYGLVDEVVESRSSTASVPADEVK